MAKNALIPTPPEGHGKRRSVEGRAVRLRGSGLPIIEARARPLILPVQVPNKFDPNQSQNGKGPRPYGAAIDPADEVIE
jgi:hypothetical protein